MLRRVATSVTIVAIALLTAACAGRVPRPAWAPGAPASTAAVERFLQLVGENDYLGMGWVFGTENGPVIEEWPAAEVEQRMYGLATVLRHDSYVVGPAEPVPGRVGRAERMNVVVHSGERRFQVPFVVARGDGRWYVELVDVEAITNIR